MKLTLFVIFIFIQAGLYAQTSYKGKFRGKDILVYPQDSIDMVSVRLIDSLPDGHYYGFFNGDTAYLKLSIHYVDHKIEGQVIEYDYERPIIVKIANYKNGLRDGCCFEYDYDTDYRTIEHEGFYKNGLRVGFQYSYTGVDKKRMVYDKCFYRNDTLIYNICYGEDSTYYKKDTGYVYQFDKNKRLIGYGKNFKGKNFALWTYYYSNGIVRSIGNFELFNMYSYLLMDRKVGLWKDYYENGQLAREYKCGDSKLYHCVLTIYKQYDINGHLIDSSKFVDGVGTYIDFYPDGKIKKELFYPDSIYLKYEKHYLPNGKLIFIEEYDKHKTKVMTEYYENGKIKSIERYVNFLQAFPPDVHYEIFGKQEYFKEDGSKDKVIIIKRRSLCE